MGASKFNLCPAPLRGPRPGRPAGHAFTLRTFKVKRHRVCPTAGEVPLDQLAREIEAGFRHFFDRRPGLHADRPAPFNL